jgi:hypothetical protein
MGEARSAEGGSQQLSPIRRRRIKAAERSEAAAPTRAGWAKPDLRKQVKQH